MKPRIFYNRPRSKTGYRGWAVVLPEAPTQWLPQPDWPTALAAVADWYARQPEPLQRQP